MQRFGPPPEPIDRVPEFSDDKGRAWLVDTPRFRKERGLSAANSALVKQWAIEAPYAHPVWHSYWLSLAHLRPVDSLLPPVIMLPGATHEFVIRALNPEFPRLPFISGDDGPQYLDPPNFGAQMKCANDAEAIAIMADTIRLVCSGKLSPDTDYMRQWIDRFGDHMLPPELRERVEH